MLDLFQNWEMLRFRCPKSLLQQTFEQKPLYINEIPIFQTRSSKFLGVIVEQHLTWRNRGVMFGGVMSYFRHAYPLRNQYQGVLVSVQVVQRGLIDWSQP